MTVLRVTCRRCGTIGTHAEIARPHSDPLSPSPALCHENRWFVEGAAALLLLFLLAAPATAQPTAADRWVSPLGSPAARKAADIESWATALTATALDVKASCFDAEDRKRGCLTMGLRTGITYGTVFTVKALVHRRRPCAPDCGIDNPNSSLYSAHTALAFQSVNFRRGSPGPRLVFSLPLALDTGKGRIAAGKHYPTDVLMGAGAGLLASLIR